MTKFEIAEFDNFDYQYCIVVFHGSDMNLTYSNSFATCRGVVRNMFYSSREFYDRLVWLDIKLLKVLRDFSNI